MKKLLSIIVAIALVVGMMPMTIFAGISDEPVMEDGDYYKLIVNTGGKGNISLNEKAEEYPGLFYIDEQDPNVLYVDKGMLEEYSEDLYDVDEVTQLIQLPEPKGYHNGFDIRNEFFIVDPSTITNYDDYDDAVEATYYVTFEDLAVDDELTIYAVWFEEVNELSVEVTAPKCGDELGEKSKVEVKIPSGEKWEISDWYGNPFWGKWEQSEIGPGWYVLFQGIVKGGDDSVAAIPFGAKYGYYMGHLNPENVTITYKDWQGNNKKGDIDHLIQPSEEPESEEGYRLLGAKVKVQHVPSKKEIKDVVKPSCTKNGSHKEIIRCSKCNDVLSEKKVVDKATGHNWGPWTVVKKATFKKDGLKKRVCKNDPSHVQTKKIPAKGKGQTLLVTMKPKGANKLVASWKKVKNIDGVDIFFTHCNKKEKKSTPKLYKSIKGNKKTSYTIKGLKKNTAYKAYAKAWTMKNGKKKYVLKSPKAHVFTGGESKGFTNAKSVLVKKKKITIRAKKSCKIKARVKKANSGLKLIPKRHTAKLRYVSADKTIAKVSKKGRIKGVGKGTCYVYVFATTGVYKKIKVRVK